MNVGTQPTKHGPVGSAVRRADVPVRALVGANLRVAEILTALIVGLAALASAGGLFLPGLYRDTAWMVPQNQGQDLLYSCILIKATTMGLALVSMTWFAWRAGQHVDLGLALVWVVLAGSGLGMTIWFLRHARS